MKSKQKAKPNLRLSRRTKIVVGIGIIAFAIAMSQLLVPRNSTASGGILNLSGMYVGNGAATRNITGLTFQPDVLILKANDGSFPMLITTSTMSNMVTAFTGSAFVNNIISSTDANGFTLGNATVPATSRTANDAGISYYFTAIKAAPGECAVGKYTGDGISGRTISGIGFQPEVVFVIPESSTNSTFRTREMPVNNSINPSNTLITTGIRTFVADGFTVGNGSAANSSGVVYHYIALKTNGNFACGMYTTTSSNTDINVGFRPSFVLLKNEGPSEAAIYTCNGLPVNSAFKVTTGTFVINNLRELNGTGFKIGSTGAVNYVPWGPEPSSYRNHYWLAFRDQLGGALPVQMVQLDVTKQNKGGALLEWATSSELNSDYFQIEKSSDNENFILINNVKAAGNSNQLLRYKYADSSPSAGTIYYRLKQVDLDGKFEYYSFKPFRNESQHISLIEMTVFPNPFVSEVALKVTAQSNAMAELKIYKADGSLVVARKIVLRAGSNEVEIPDVARLHAGKYVVSIETSDNNISKTLVKM